MEVKDFLREGDPEEGVLILMYVMDMTRSQVYFTREIPEEFLEEAQEIRKRRATGMPLQYAIGRWNFYGRDFKVDERALIPRPETERLVEETLALARPKDRILDLCTGTGAIGITLALEGDFELVASDIDRGALELAKENVERLQAPNITLVASDLYQNLKGAYDIIVSNPPYVTAEEMKSLEPELSYEPEKALYGGEDGLFFYREIVKGAGKRLRPGGHLLMEIGSAQGNRVFDMCKTAGFEDVKIIKDYTGRDRVIKATSVKEG